MTTGSLRVPATGALADLLACPPPLLDVTLDQLRTLLAVREAGSPLAAARILGREHSSVRKQVDTLNHAFQQICGEALVVKQGRGQDYLFTPTGEAMTQIAAGMFTSWLTGITERRRRLGATVTVATTEFTVQLPGPGLAIGHRRIHPPRDRAEHRPCPHPRLPGPAGRQGR